MSCAQTFTDYALRSIGIGARLLPKADITLCEQVVLIGSGMIWNVYYGLLAIVSGFLFATALAVMRASNNRLLSKSAEWFIFLFRGTPLFIQFFFAYEAFVLLPKLDIEIPLGFTTIVAGNPLADKGLAWCIDRVIPKYVRLFSRDILWCAKSCAKRGYRGGRRLWHGRVYQIQTHHLANLVETCLAILYQ